MDKNKLPDFVLLNNDYFLVNNVVGFQAAINVVDPTRYMQRGRSFDVPISYPCVIKLQKYYCGDDHLSCECFSVEMYLQQLHDVISTIEKNKHQS